VVTGGHTVAQALVQADLEAVSAANRYTVSLFGPAARIVPSLLCLLVTSAADAAVGVELVAPYAGVAAAVLALLVLLLLLLPQPASRAATIGIATKILGFFTWHPPRRIEGLPGCDELGGRFLPADRVKGALSARTRRCWTRPATGGAAPPAAGAADRSRSERDAPTRQTRFA
jgi:hypothetical protein